MSNIECRFGSECKYLTLGGCRFYHPRHHLEIARRRAEAESNPTPSVGRSALVGPPPAASSSSSSSSPGQLLPSGALVVVSTTAESVIRRGASFADVGVEQVAPDTLLAGRVRVTVDGVQWMELDECEHRGFLPLVDVVRVALEQRPRLFRCFEAAGKQAGWPGMPQQVRTTLPFGIVFEVSAWCTHRPTTSRLGLTEQTYGNVMGVGWVTLPTALDEVGMRSGLWVVRLSAPPPSTTVTPRAHPSPSTRALPGVPHNAVAACSVQYRAEGGQRWLRLDTGGWLPESVCTVVAVEEGPRRWLASVDCEVLAHPGHWAAPRGHLLGGEAFRSSHLLKGPGFWFARLADGRGWAVVRRVSDAYVQAVDQQRVDKAVEEEEPCVVCLEGRCTVGFVHGESVHRVCCRACADSLMLRPDASCPVCRALIDRVVSIF